MVQNFFKKTSLLFLGIAFSQSAFAYFVEGNYKASHASNTHRNLSIRDRGYGQMGLFGKIVFTFGKKQNWYSYSTTSRNDLGQGVFQGSFDYTYRLYTTTKAGLLQKKKTTFFDVTCQFPIRVSLTSPRYGIIYLETWVPESLPEFTNNCNDTIFRSKYVKFTDDHPYFLEQE